MSRREIFPPMRPSPMMPICMGRSPLCERAFDRRFERGKSGIQIAAEMNAQRAPLALKENAEIAARLRRLDDAEARAMARNGKVVGVVGRDLQKHAAVRAAFVGLPGGMQKTRAEFQT